MLIDQPIDTNQNEGLMIMQTTADLAADFNTTPRTLRKFLRAEDMGVGKGSRYALPTTKREVNSLKKRFTAWQESLEAKKSPAAAIEAEVEALEEVLPQIELDEEPTSLDDLECPLDA